MATRDRTPEYLQLRNARPRFSESQQLMNEEQMAAVYVSPPWVSRLDDVRQLERNIQNKMAELEQKRKEHLKTEFGTSRDEEQEEAEIERLQNMVNVLFQRSEASVKELEAVYLSDKDDGGTDAELSILRNVKMCVVAEIGHLSKHYRENQRRYMMDKKKKIGVEQRWGNGDEVKAIQEQLERDAQREKFLQKGMTQDQIEQIMLNSDMVTERTKEFEKIYQSIKQLHEMFTDMNQMIIDQGSVLDRIDYNVEITHERVEKGKKELVEAAKLQKAGTFKLCVLFLVVMIIGFLLALAVKIMA